MLLIICKVKLTRRFAIFLLVLFSVYRFCFFDQMNGVVVSLHNLSLLLGPAVAPISYQAPNHILI